MWNDTRAFARVRQVADRINRLDRRRRKRPRTGEPVGPRLVKGRGRRRPRWRLASAAGRLIILSLVVALTVAAGTALAVAIFRRVVVPLATG